MNSRVFIAIAILMIPQFSGCVGITYSGNKQNTVIGDEKLLARENQTKPNRPADFVSQNGIETFIEKSGEREWCGLTLWAIIPIPVMLPHCQKYRELTYKEQDLIQVKRQDINRYWAICSPLFLPDFCINYPKW